MSDHDLRPCPDAAGWQLSLLARTYPALRFRCERAGAHGLRWIAERRNGLDPGLHTTITARLHELREALREGPGAPWQLNRTPPAERDESEEREPVAGQ